MNYSIAEWSEWLIENAHFCPHCPEDEQEAVVLEQDLRDFIMGRQQKVGLDPAPVNNIPFTTYNKEL